MIYTCDKHDKALVLSEEAECPLCAATEKLEDAVKEALKKGKIEGRQAALDDFDDYDTGYDAGYDQALADEEDGKGKNK